MTPFKFTPEDFDALGSLYCANDSSKLANARLDSWLKDATRVYAYMGPASRPGGMWIVEGVQDADSTHTALLINIEPIEKPRCSQHEEPTELHSSVTGPCPKCGKLLKQTWNEI